MLTDRTRRIALVMQGGAGWVGGIEYVKNLILAIGELPEAERSAYELNLISGTELEPGLANVLKPYLAQSYVLSKDLPPATISNRSRWLLARHLRRQPNLRFSEFISAQKFDFLYPLTYDNQYNIGVSLPLGTALGGCRWAGWIPDFQHRFMPELFQAAEIAKRDAGISTLSQEAKTIVFSSESAARDFRGFYPGAPARAEVLHFHTHLSPKWFEVDAQETRRWFHLPETFLLVSNQFWQHKNHGLLFEALALLRREGLCPEVVCTGQTADFRKKDYFNSLLRLIHEFGIASQVHILGLIERTEQIQLMRCCMAVVQPSLFEGWSTVVEDARALGKTVIASDIDVHLEQHPHRARYFSAKSAADLARVIAEAWPTLSPGPDLVREVSARTDAAKGMQDYGRRFLEIVRTALS